MPEPQVNPLAVGLTSGFIDVHVSNEFMVHLGGQYLASIAGNTIATAEWTTNNFATYYSVEFFNGVLAGNTGTKTGVLPADALAESASIKWRVRIKFRYDTTDYNYTRTDGIGTLTTTDSAAVAVPVRPAYAYEDAQNPITFEWSHSTSNGTAQTAADLQYSTDGVTWLTLANVAGASDSVIIPAGTFPPGSIYWRVRTYNANGVAGAWSDATMFKAVAPVPVPAFASVSTSTARPAFVWTASVQAAFELEIEQGSSTVYASGPVISTAKNYTITDYLTDGNYTARLRVYSDEGDTSDWVSYAFAVTTIKPNAPVLAGAQIKYGVQLTASGAPEGSAVYILRDGLPIAKGATYKDYATAAEHTYIARVVDANGCFADSAPVTIGPVLKGSFIAPASNLANVVSLLLNRDARPTRDYNWSPEGAATFYAGREYPVYEYSSQQNETGNYSRSFRSRAEFDGFMSVAGRGGTMLYRDRDGTAFWCAVTGLSWTFNRHTYDVSFSLVRVSHKEGIAYD